MKTKIILPKKDQDFLEELGLPFRIEKEGYLDKIFVIISQVEINSKYYSAANKSAVDVCIIIPPGYPNSQIDMTHFFPGLVRTDKRPIPHTYNGGRLCNVANIKWQTWSRHRTGENIWDPRQDCIATHLIYTESFLKREVSDLMTKGTETSKVISTFTRRVEEDILIFPKPFSAQPAQHGSGRLVINFKK